MTRDWLQASTHGMARRSEIDVVGLRDVGLLPMFSDADLADRGGRLEVVDETGCLVDQFGVGAVRARGQIVEHLVGGSRGITKAFDVEQRRFEGRGQQGLQIAVRDPWFGVLRGDDLALLGEPQRAVHRARRLRQDGVVAGAAAAADGAAATVEEPQPDSGLAGGLDEVQLGAVQRPVGGQVAAVLVGVGVAEHDLLAVAARRHQRPVQRKIKRRFENRRATLQVVDRLEQRHDADRDCTLRRRTHRAGRPPSTAPPPRACPTPTGTSR